MFLFAVRYSDTGNRNHMDAKDKNNTASAPASRIVMTEENHSRCPGSSAVVAATCLNNIGNHAVSVEHERAPVSLLNAIGGITCIVLLQKLIQRVAT